MPAPYDYLGAMGGAANIGGVNQNIQQTLLGQQNIQQNDNVLAQQQRAEQARQATAIATDPNADPAHRDAAMNALQQTDAPAAAALRAQMQQRQALTSYFQNPTAKGTMELITSFPALKDEISKGWDYYQGASKDAKLAATADAYGYLQAGDAAGAIKIIRDHEAADKAAGLDVSGYQQLADTIQKDPKSGLAIAGLMLAAGAGPEKFAEAHGKIGERQRADELQPSAVLKGTADASKAQTEAQYAAPKIESELATATATRQRMAAQTANEIANTNISNGRLALDTQKLTADIDQRQQEIDQKYGQLTGPAEKIVNDSSAAAAVAVQSAAKAQALADSFKTSGMGASYKARGAELWKQVTGSQDAYTQMRAEWQQMRNKGALANRADMPGAMSDADRQFLLQGFPRDDANPAYIARWLGTMARASEAVAKQEDSKAEWVAQNGNLGPTRRDIVVDGHRVPKGMTFSQQQALQRKMLPQGVPALAEDIAARAAR